MDRRDTMVEEPGTKGVKAGTDVALMKPTRRGVLPRAALLREPLFSHLSRLCS